MKRWLLILALSSIAWGQSTEILRPTVDINGGTSLSNVLDTNCQTALYISSVAQPNFYDSGGLATSSTFSLVNGQTTTTECSGRLFKIWGTTTNTYTALTLNVNTSGTSLNLNGEGTISYSTNSGATWTQIRQSNGVNGWAQTTDTVTLSASQDLTKLQVAINNFTQVNSPGGNGQGTFSITGFDIWTSGTFTPTVPGGSLPPPPVVAISPVIISYFLDPNLQSILAARNSGEKMSSMIINSGNPNLPPNIKSPLIFSEIAITP